MRDQSDSSCKVVVIKRFSSFIYRGKILAKFSLKILRFFLFFFYFTAAAGGESRTSGQVPRGRAHVPDDVPRDRDYGLPEQHPRLRGPKPILRPLLPPGGRQHARLLDLLLPVPLRAPGDLLLRLPGGPLHPAAHSPTPPGRLAT